MGSDSLNEMEASTNSLMFAGIVATTIGIVAVAVSAVASVSIALVIGLLVIVLADARLTAAFQSSATSGRTTTGAILGALLVIGGLWSLFNPSEATVGLTAVIAIVFIVMGVARLSAAIVHRGGEGIALVGFSGALATIIGVPIASSVPGSLGWAVGLLVGIQFLFDGIGLVLATATTTGAIKTGDDSPA